MRSAVIPKLSELPADPEQRNAILNQSHAEPGPEQKPVSKKARRVESAAATAAAVIGVLMSNHSNVTLGGAAAIDENLLFEDAPKRKAKGEGDKDENGDKDGKAPSTNATDEPLVPWVRLK